jgi:hypothetical protein
MARQVAFIGENQTEPYVYGFDVNLYGNDFTFIPKSVYEKGFVSDGKQYYLPGVLNQEFNQAFQPYAKPFSVDEVQKVAPNFKTDYKKSTFEDNQGYLVPTDLSQTYLSKFNTYDVGEEKDGFVFGGITGLATNEQGQRYFNVSASGMPNANAWATEDGNVAGQWYDPGKKWYETAFGKALIIAAVVGTGMYLAGGAAAGGAAAGGAGGSAAGAGAAGGAAAGGTAAAGTAAGTGLTVGAGGATGLTAGAAGATGVVAPSGFVLAPSVGASVGAGTAAAVGAGTGGGSSAGGTGLLDTAQFGQTGQTGITPGAAGQGLQTPTTPGLSSMGGGTGVTVPVSGGTVTQLGMVPTGATPVLGDPASFINDPNVLGNTVFTTDTLLTPGAATGPSTADTLRNLNRLRGLLGAGENPLVPQQQGLPQSGRGSQGVDYSGLLSLLQLQARTPNVASLTAPAQLRQIYQPTLLPNVLSLLG